MKTIDGFPAAAFGSVGDISVGHSFKIQRGLLADDIPSISKMWYTYK